MTRTLSPALLVLLCPVFALAQPSAPARRAPPPPPSVAPPATYDPSQLPSVQGRVLAYALTPRGDVDGLVLADGTEVHLPKHLGPQLVATVRPGDAVVVRGVAARGVPVLDARTVTNVATGTTLTDAGPPPPPGTAAEERPLQAQGRVRAQLHGREGQLHGVVLEDGTIVRLPPPEAERFAALLAPGASLVVRGTGVAGPLGRALEAEAIGPTASALAAVERPAPPRRR